MAHLHRVLICLMLLVCTAEAGQTVLIEHNGQADPAAQGWKVEGGGALAIGKANATGEPAWIINDDAIDAGLAYVHTLTPEQSELAHRQGFIATWRLDITRSAAVDSPNRAIEVNIQLHSAAHTRRYNFQFGLTAAGDPMVEMVLGGGPIVFLGAGGGPHLYEFAVPAGEDRGLLSIDGRFVTEYAGWGDTSPGILFGSVTPGSQGEGRWSLFRFCSPIPSPQQLQQWQADRQRELDAIAAENAKWPGFPPIHKHRPGQRRLSKLTSDAVTGLLRPTWTRAVTDIGAWPVMLRFRSEIFLFYPHVNGHDGLRYESTGKTHVLVSGDEGKSWAPRPPLDFAVGEAVADESRLIVYAFTRDGQTQARVTTDGEHYADAVNCYVPPFWLWGVYRDRPRNRWLVAAHAIPPGDVARTIHLLQSPDALNWALVSEVSKFGNESESTIHIEPDETMRILIRRKYSGASTLATASPPYTQWTHRNLPQIAEGERFVSIGGRTFLGSRAHYTGDDKALLAQPDPFSATRSYSMVYRLEPDRSFRPWAVMDSAGDCSYPSLVETPDQILCAYYSQHEDNVCKVFLCGFDRKAFLAE